MASSCAGRLRLRRGLARPALCGGLGVSPAGLAGLGVPKAVLFEEGLRARQPLVRARQRLGRLG